MRRPLSDNGLTLNGNDRFEGFVKDLVDALANENGFEFRFRIVNDSKYGAPDPKAKAGWNGMIGELIRNEVDLVSLTLILLIMRIRPLINHLKRSNANNCAII